MTKKQILEIVGNIKQGFLNGLGFSIGATLGFALVSTILVNVIRAGGGLPVVGSFLASIVSATQEALLLRGH